MPARVSHDESKREERREASRGESKKKFFQHRFNNKQNFLSLRSDAEAESAEKHVMETVSEIERS
jgi:hypothetical protein